jgi:biotin carboxyl carrier protein
VKKLRVTVNGVSYDVDVEVLEDDDTQAAYHGLPPMAAPAPAAAPGAAAPAAPPKAAPAAPAKAPAAPAAASGGGNELPAPLAGIIVDVKVAVGDTVKEGDAVLVIEAMKMNTNVSSPVSGSVKSVNVKSGDSVRAGQVLMTFE